jgi:hypothetical protein
MPASSSSLSIESYSRDCDSVPSQAVSATLTAVLEQLLAAYQQAPIVAAVCDNVIIHHSELVNRWLVAIRGWVLHGASYRPDDNPVERIWVRSRRGWRNSPALTIQGRVRQVHAFFHQPARHRCWHRPPPSQLGYPTVTYRTSVEDVPFAVGFGWGLHVGSYGQAVTARSSRPGSSAVARSSAPASWGSSW